MRALLQNPVPAAAIARPASMTASALAADREPGAPRAPEQGFAHMLQDSQRRSAIDAPPQPASQTSPAPQPQAPQAPAVKSAAPPARDAAAPTRHDGADGAGESDGAGRSDTAEAASPYAAATSSAEAAPPKDKARPRSTARVPGRTAETNATAAGEAGEGAEPKLRGIAAAATDAAPASPSTIPVPNGLDAVLAQWQAARKPTLGTGDASEADVGGAGAPASNSRLGGRADAAAEALRARPELERISGADLGAAVSTAALARNDEAAALTARPAFDKLLNRSLEAVVAPAASSAPTFGAGVEAAAVATVNVPARVDSPEFAPALAMQVSLLTSDGVQKAELHLNPAEMGPVSVQISLDGSQAHVSFGADLAATRQAIEAGLPDLAGALREAGFTLAGGGVSEHANGHRQPGGDAGQPAGGRHDERTYADTQPIIASLRHATRAGGIDLYA